MKQQSNTKKDFMEAYSNWGESLSDLARLKTGAEKNDYLRLSLEKNLLKKKIWRRLL